MLNCKELLLESEQMRELTLIEHNKVECKKNEEIKRINCEFDRIQHMLTQRKNYIIGQLNSIFSDLGKNLISDLATAEGQTEYCQHLYERIQEFYNRCFPAVPAPSSEEQKHVPIDITTLNGEVNESLPKFEKELNSLQKSFCPFSYNGIKYPQFNLNLAEITNFVKKIGVLVNAEGFVDKFNTNFEHIPINCLSRDNCVLFMSSSLAENYLLQYDLAKGTWIRPIVLRTKSGSPEFLKSMVATCLPSGDIMLTGGVEPNKIKSSNKCKILSRSELSLIHMNDMLNGRYSHCALELFGKLYAIGGYDGAQRIASCERIRYIEREIQSTAPILWKPIASLNIPRANLIGCVFDKRTIYVFGGEQSPSLEKYNVLMDAWELIPPIRDFDPLLTLSAIGLHKVDDTEELVIFGSYYMFLYDWKTGMACNKSEYISQMMERSMKYNGRVVSFTKEQPLYCVTYQLNPFIIQSKTSTFRHHTDIELKSFPAAITKCHP